MRARQGIACAMGPAACVAAMVLASCGCAGTRPAMVAVSAAPRSQPSAERAKVLEQLAAKQNPDEFDQMIRLTDLDGEALKAFMVAVDQRLRNLDEFDKDAKKGIAARTSLRDQMNAAQGAGDAKKADELKAALARADEEYLAFRERQRAMVMGRLTLGQQQAWATHVLQGKAARALRRAQLTDEQKESLAGLCRAQSAAYVKAGTVDSDPYLKKMWPDVGEGLLASVRKQVLTREQRAALDGK